MIFKIIIRFLLRNKAYLVINVLGFALSLACMILINLYIADEKSWDSYHSKSERIYRVINTTNFNGVGEESSSCPFPVGPTLKEEFPNQVESMVRFYNFQADKVLMQYKNTKDYEKHLFFCDSTVFQVFDIPLLSGNPKTCLSAPFSIIISESAAKKYFNNENPIGKEIILGTRSKIKITGVFKDQPAQSHLKYDFLGSMSTISKSYKNGLPSTWVWNPVWTYIVLKPGVSKAQLESNFKGFIQKYFFDAEKDHVGLYLQPLLDIHLGKSLDYERQKPADKKYLAILTGIEFFLLLIAIINYVNLSTAFSAKRAKEIGIRKTLGSSKSSLIKQFLLESVIIGISATLFAFILVELFLPLFNNFTSKNFTISHLLSDGLILQILGYASITAFIAGLYPAVYLSNLNPLKVFKEGMFRGSGGGKFRKVLIILQFSITLFLITGTLSIFDQLRYLKNANLGFDKENIIIIPSENTPVAVKYNDFKKELLKNKEIQSVTTMDYIIGTSHNTHEFRPEGHSQKNWDFYPAIVIDYDFLNTFNIELVAGRDFNQKDSGNGKSGILINESMVKYLKWGKNENAIGKQFSSLNKEEKVIGVFKDFNVKSLHNAKGPFVLNMKEIPWEVAHYRKFIAVKVNTKNHDQLISFLKSNWDKYAPDYPFQYTHLDKELNKLYDGENNLNELAALFTLILLLITCIGLYGYSAYMTTQRTKEIGIRKVLGASNLQVIKLLFKDFSYLLGIATLISIPVSWFVIDSWLKSFAYHAEINILYLFAAALISFSIACLTAYYHVRKVAGTNPSIVLKYE